MKNRIYIFISHSHKDIDDVRIIRNYLESFEGGEPILFFLLSQTDENKISELIKEEINARIWFILCDSKNARDSSWVKSEMEYATSVGKHNIITINLKKAVINHQLTDEYKVLLNETYAKFKRLSNIFISYSRSDYGLVKKIVDYLAPFGIHLSDDRFSSWERSAKQEIMDAACVLTFFGTTNHFQQIENEFASEQGKPTFYIMLDKEIEIIKRFSRILQVPVFFFDTSKIEESSDAMIKWLFDRI